MGVLRVVFVLSLSLLVSAYALAPITYFFVRYGSTDYNVEGDIFTDVGPYAARSGLRNGDRIAPETGFFDRLWIVGGAFFHPIDDRKTVTVLRNGVRHTVILSADPSGYIGDSFQGKVEIVLRDSALLAFVIVGTFLVLARPRPLTWAFYFFTLGPTVPTYLIVSILLNLPMPLGFILNLVRLTLLVGGAFGFAAFVLMFPGDRARGWRSVVLGLFLVYAVLMYLDNLIGWFTEGTAIASSDIRIATSAAGPFLGPIIVAERAITAGLPPYALWVGPLLIGIVSLLGKYRAAVPNERQRLRWAIAGILLANGSVTLQVIAIWHFNPAITPALLMALRFGAIAAPFVIGYAVFKHRVIDARFAMSRAAVYAAIAAILAGLFIGVDAFVTTFFANSRLQTAISLAAVAGTALLFGRLHGHLVALVDGALFPRRREKLQRLKHVREQLDDEHDVTAIERLLNGGVCEALGLASSALFVSSGDGGFVRDISVGWERGTMWHALRDDPIVATLGNGGSAALRLDDDAWLEAAIPHGAARPALVIPLRFRRRTCALQFYGAHVTGGDLDPAEIKGLKELCAGVAPVFANASQ